MKAKKMVETKGEYIVIEGMDGSGKSMQVDLLSDAYSKNSFNTIPEPGGTKIGDSLRTIIKDGNQPRQPESSFDLFNVARRELVANVIGPSIMNGISIISDRNWMSSVAYQGFGEGVDIDHIIQVSERTMGDYFMPDKSLILEVSPEVAEARMKERGDSYKDYFENKGMDFFKKVVEGYYWLAERYDIPRVMGDQAPEAVHEDIKKVLAI